MNSSEDENVTPSDEVNTELQRENHRKPLRTARFLSQNLLGIGLHSDEDRRTLVAVNAAKFLLTLVSGYNTYFGLSEMMPRIFALSAMLGVQTLLFATASRVTTVVRIGRSVKATLSIYIITATASIFFAFLSVDGYLNNPEVVRQRQSQQLKELAHSLASSTSKEARERAANIEQEAEILYLDWQATIGTEASKVEQDLRTQLILAEKKATAARKKHRRELEKGGSKYRINGVWRYSSAGDGEIAKEIDENATNLELQAEALKVRLSDIKSLRMKIAREASVSLDPRQIDGRTEIVSSCSALGLAAPLCRFPPALQDLLTETGVEGRLNDVLASDICSARHPEAPEKWLAKIEKCSDSLAIHTDIRDFQERLVEARERLLAAGHAFKRSVGSLKSLDLLSVASLLIAIMVDALILLCGILAARPLNYLQIRRTEDLDEFQELAISDVLRCKHVSAEMISEPVARRAKDLLDRCHLVREGALLHHGLMLTEEGCGEFSSEVNALLSMGLCVPAEEILFELAETPELRESAERHLRFHGGVAIRTIFALWLCEQISRQGDVGVTFEPLSEDLRDLLGRKGRL